MGYATIPPGASDTAVTSWWQQREARARALLNYAITQVDTPIPFNFNVTKPVLGGGPPTVDTTKPGTVYKLNGASDTLNFMPDSTAKGVLQVRVMPWYFATQVSFAATTISSSYAIPWGLDNGGSYIEVALNQATSATHHYLLAGGGTGTLSVDLGASCALGGALCPIGPPVTIEGWFDPYWAPADGGVPGRMQIAFQDTVVATQYAYDGGLDALPLTTALAPDIQANNATLAMRCYGGFLMLKGAQL